MIWQVWTIWILCTQCTFFIQIPTVINFTNFEINFAHKWCFLGNIEPRIMKDWAQNYEGLSPELWRLLWRPLQKLSPDIFRCEPHDVEWQRVDGLGQLVLGLDEIHLLARVQVLHFYLFQNFLQKLQSTISQDFLFDNLVQWTLNLQFRAFQK